MATRTLEVQITGDPSKFNRSLGHVDTSVDNSTKKFHRLGTVGKAAFSGLGLAAGAAAAVGLKQAATAAVEAEKTQARLEAQLKASGLSFKAHGDEIEKVIGKVSRLSGLDDEDLTDSFTNIVRVTGDVNKSLKLTGLAADFARAKHMDVAKAGELVGKVAGGNTGILGRYGIKIKEGATATEALGELQKKFSGQAKAYGDTTAGSMEKAGVAWENLLEIVGEKLAPVIRKAAELLTGLFDTQSKGNKVIRRAADAYLDYLRTVMDVVKRAARAVGVWVDDNREQINDVIRAFRRVGNFIKDIVTDVIIPVIKRIAPIVEAFVERSLHAIGNLVRLVTALINGDWSKAWDAFKDLVKDAVTDTVRIFSRLVKALKEIVGRAAKAVLGAAVDVGEAIIDGMVSGIKKGAGKITGAVSGVVKGAIGKAGDVAGSLNPFGDGLGSAPLPSGLGPASLDGADAALGPFAAMANRFGLQVTDGARPPGTRTSTGGVSLHSTGDAIDVSGPPSGMMGLFQFLRKNYGSRLAELIYTPGGTGVKNGQPYTYSGVVAADHYDHVHIGYTGGIGDGLGHTSGVRRKARTGDGIGTAAKAAYAAGFRGQALINMIAIAGRESSYNPRAQNLTYPDHSIGLWQINQLAHKGRYGSDQQLMDPFVNARAAYALYKQSGLAPWVGVNYGNAASFLDDAARAVAGLDRSAAGGGGSPGAGGGGGGAANGPAARFRAEQKRVKGAAGGALEAARNEALTGGGRLELGVARAQTMQARATAKDDLAGLIKGLKQERDLKRKRLRRVRKLLKRRHRLGRKNRVALLNEEAQLLGDIGDLNDTIKEYKADQAGGATTVTRAEQLDAGVDPDAATAADAGGAGGADLAAEAQAARDAVAEEIRNLVAQQVQNQEDIKRLMQTQQPQLMAALAAVVSGEIGGKVGLGFQGGGYYPGSTARY